MTNNQAIGIFDSGLGGLSVVKSIMDLMPDENIIYFGDSANAPYGEKNKEEVIALSNKVVDKLMDFKVKAIVVACNTASSAVGEHLRQTLNIPVILMEPALKPAVERFPNGKILILATAMTLKEEKFQLLLNRYEHTQIDLIAAGDLVHIVENNEFDTTKNVLKQLSPSRDYDAVVLGCTHFVFLKEQIQAYFKAATIIDGNLGTAKYLQTKLAEKELLNPNDNGKITILNSNSAMLSRSHQLLSNPAKQVAEITIKIKQILAGDKFNPLEKELLRLKYLENKNINFRLLARKHNKSIKFIENSFKKSDARLYNLLK